MNSEKNAPRYFMHKYWGEKPATGISPLVEKYTNPGDTIIDPFSGYGVFCCEAYLKNRNVIVNDLNPIANFIAHNLFSNDVNISRVQSPRLFGAENRLFVVFVDSTDMNQSWKMKRAFSLIEPKVNTYLDSFSENSLKKIEFTFSKKCTKVLPT